MTPVSLISSACPLVLCSLGALFSEYAGVLALFLEGMISLSGFLTYTFTIFTGNPVSGLIISALCCCTVTGLLAFLVERFKAHSFIAGIALNIIFSSMVSMLSFLIFKTRGVLSSPDFNFQISKVRIFTIIVTVIFSAAAILFLRKTKAGIYLRITGSDADVLTAKGVNPAFYRILSWILAALFASLSGSFLTFRINSFVPNISSGRGWMALAAVFLGKKKSWRIILAVLIFCAADIFSSVIQNYISIPSAVVLSFPYLVVLIMIAAGRK